LVTATDRRIGRNERHVIFYGWFIVAAGCLIYALGYGSRYSFSVTFISLLEEFQWPRDTTALMLSIHVLVYGLVAPISGALVDRIGPRKTMAMGATLLSFGLAMSRWGIKPWHFYCSFGLFSGMGLSLMGAVPFTTVVRNWFETRRGLAFSLMAFGTGGSYASYPAVALLIDKVGWRNTFLVEAVIVAAVALPLITLVVRYHPREKGLTRDGVKGTGEGTAYPPAVGPGITDPSWAAVDWTLSRAIRTARFWLLCLTAFSIWGVMQHIMVAHHVAFAIDVGYSRIYASSVLSLFGITVACGALAGLVSDRIGREATFALGGAMGISGMVVLMFIRDTAHPWMLYYYALSLGFGSGLINPTLTASITDIFQGARVGSIIGCVWLSFAVGGAIGPWLGGWIFELTGNYLGAFMVAAVLFALACVALWLAAPRKVRRVPGLAARRQHLP
jgi:MFS family permease